MRQLIFTIILSAFIINVQFGQEADDHLFCGLSDEYFDQNYALSQKREIRAYIDQFLQNKLSLRSAPKKIPIQVHVFQRSDGTDEFNLEVFEEALQEVNNYFKNAGMAFFLCSEINYVAKDAMFTYSREKIDQFSSLEVPQVINLFIPNEIDLGGRRVGGFAYLPRTMNNNNMVFTNQRSFWNVKSFTNLLAHELGHFFGLLHTHGRSNTELTNELVDGSNCQWAGDEICDTPAEPRLSGLIEDCRYIGDEVDLLGQKFDPNPLNIMSYSVGTCKELFSQEQYARMAYFLEYHRSYLSCEQDCIVPGFGLRTTYTSLMVGPSIPNTGAERYLVKYREKGESTWTEEQITDPSHSYFIQRHPPCTTFEVQVKSICSPVSESEWSEIQTFQTKGCDDNYCYSYGTPGPFYIQKLKLNDYEVESGSVNRGPWGAEGYGEYTTTYTTRMANGRNYPIELTPGGEPTANEIIYWQIWLDANRDSIFDPTEELIFRRKGTGREVICDSIFIPGTTAGGARLRITLSQNGFVDPCSTQDVLEVEDYYVLLVGAIDTLSAKAIQLAPTSCENTNDGSAFVEAYGGLPPYRFLWYSGEERDTASALKKGEQVITVIDHLNDSLLVPFTMNGPSGISTTVSMIHEPSCFGSLDAVATVEEEGAVSEIQFEWDNGEKNRTAQRLSGGLHYLTVTYNGACITVDSIYIPEPPKPDFEIEIQGHQEWYRLGDTLSISISGGEYFSWQGPHSFSSTDSVLLIPNLQAVHAGTYSVNARRDGACRGASIEVDFEVTRDMVLHYDFSNCQALDQSGNNRHGTLFGDPNCQIREESSILHLNENPDNASCHAGGEFIALPSLDAIWDKGFSIQAWVNMGDPENWERIIDFGNTWGDNGGQNILFSREGTSNNLVVENWIDRDRNYMSQNNRLVIPDGINNNQLSLYTLVIDSMGLISIYVNGALVGQKQGDPIANVLRERNYLGRSHWCDPDLQGSISDLKIYNRALLPEEIQQAFRLELERGELLVKKKNITRAGTFRVPFDTLELLETWWEPVFIEITQGNDTLGLPFNSLDWTFSDEDIGEIVEINNEYKIRGLQAGETQVTGVFNSDTVRFILKVNPPV